MTIALILSGGTGTRLGFDIPKQYIEVNGRPIISYSIESLSSHNELDAIQIVADPVWQGQIQDWLAEEGVREIQRIFKPWRKSAAFNPEWTQRYPRICQRQRLCFYPRRCPSSAYREADYGLYCRRFWT